MTVCLAALCKDDEVAHAVVAADRMVTLAGFIDSVVELQAWMGHADQRTTTRYLHHKSQGDPARRLAGAFKVETSEEPRELARPAGGPRVAQTG